MANHTHQTGRLTADPELRVTTSGMEVCNMRLAVQRRRGKDGEDRGAFFINVVAFNGLAGVCNRYLHKGSRVLVEGQLDVEEWTGRDEMRRYTPKIIAEQVEFLDPPSSDSAPGEEPVESSQQEEPEQAEPKPRRSRAKATA
jgi:single-strand DNA-binding protein